MPADKTIDTVMLIISGGLLLMGLGSALLGWALRVWDRVKHSQVAAPIMSRENDADERTDRTDGRTDHVSEADQWLDRLEVDRTKTAVIELLVYSDWTVAQIRGVIRGENAAIGAEIEAARQRLGIVDPPRQLRVKDEHGERLIAMK